MTSSQESQQIERLSREIEQLKAERLISAPVCHICEVEYDQTKVPKVLRCGHTMCIECAGRIAGASTIRCPFDRVDTPMNDGVHSLSTNFTLVEIMEPLPRRTRSKILKNFVVFVDVVLMLLVSYAIYSKLPHFTQLFDSLPFTIPFSVDSVLEVLTAFLIEKALECALKYIFF